MPDRHRTRERQLAKLAARRAAERAKKRRQRITAMVVGVSLFVVVIIVLLVAFVGGGKGKPLASPSATASPGPTATPCPTKAPPASKVKKKTYSAAPKMTIDTSKKYLMTMVTSCGTITIELDPSTAPKTVNSLVFLTNQHFFDGQFFHRTVQVFVIQGGDPFTIKGANQKQIGTGGPGYTTTDAPPAGSTYPVGTVAMAKGGNDPAGSSGSQFFIVTGENADAALAPGGTGQYAIVGHVSSGIDVAKNIERLPRVGGTGDGRPQQDVYIIKVTVEVEK